MIFDEMIQKEAAKQAEYNNYLAYKEAADPAPAADPGFFRSGYNWAKEHPVYAGLGATGVGLGIGGGAYLLHKRRKARAEAAAKAEEAAKQAEYYDYLAYKEAADPEAADPSFFTKKYIWSKDRHGNVDMREAPSAVADPGFFRSGYNWAKEHPVYTGLGATGVGLGIGGGAYLLHKRRQAAAAAAAEEAAKQAEYYDYLTYNNY